MLASGFTNALVSKFLLVYVIASSIALAIFDIKHLAHIQVSPHLWRYGQLSRLLVWQVAGYANSTEALFAAMLVYHLRVVERMWGGRKMATFLLTTLPYTTLLPPILLALVARPLSLNTLNYLPSGPTATIFALLAQYHAAVPYTFKYRISTTSNPSDTKPSLTLLLSDKSTTYLVAAQLALSQFPATLLPAAVGWFVGAAWRAEMLPGSSRFVSGARGGWRIPAWIVGEKERITTTAARRGQDDNGERYEDLRRRLEDESRAAAASSGVGGVEGEHQRQRRTQGGAGIFERFRGAF